MKTDISNNYRALAIACKEKGFEFTYANQNFYIVDRWDQVHFKGNFDESFDWIENTVHRDKMNESEVNKDFMLLPEYNPYICSYAIVAIAMFLTAIFISLQWMGFVGLIFLIHAWYKLLKTNKDNKQK